MSFPHSRITGQVKNSRIEGIGRYEFPDGTIYVGEFLDGNFHGKGTLYLTTGGRYDAEWDMGKVIQGKYVFADGLEFEEKDWNYCTPTQDRRFHFERQGDFLLGKATKNK